MEREKINIIIELTKIVNTKLNSNIKPNIKKGYCMLKLHNTNNNDLLKLIHSIRKTFRKKIYVWLDEHIENDLIISELKFITH